MPAIPYIAIAIYLAIISTVAVVITVKDKRIATRNGARSAAAAGKSTGKSNAKQSGKSKNSKPATQEWRVPEKTLLIISALGGSVAMLLTMLKIRHKTKHMKFMIGIPVIIAMQIAAVIAAIVLF